MPSNVFKMRDWLILGPVALLMFALGIWGFEVCQTAACKIASPVQAVLRTFSLIKGTGNFAPGQDPWQLVIAQVMLPLLALVSGFKLALQNIRRDVRVALAHRTRDHAIVCGLGDTGRQVVESFLDAGHSVVAVTLDTDAPHAVACDRRGVAVLKGDATQPSMLKLAGLRRARALILTSGSDATNIEIGMRARDFLGVTPGVEGGLKILPELRNDWLYNVLRTHRAATLGSEAASFRIFNLNANAARILLQAPSFMSPIPGAPGANPHLIIAGFGQMGAEIVLQAARCNFAVPGRKLSVTVLDARGEASMAVIQAKCPHISGLVDFERVTCSFAVDDPGAWGAVEKTLRDKPAVAVVVALKADDVALDTALEFRRRLDRAGRFETPVFVRLRQQRKLGAFLAELEVERMLPDRLSPFGDLAGLTKPELLLEQTLDELARAAHAVWLKQNHTPSPAAVPWEHLPERFKQSNRTFADHIAVKLRRLGLRLVKGPGPAFTLSGNEIELLARMEHWRWTVELRSLGWQHGKTRDEFLLRHPLLVDWDELSGEAKEVNRELVRRIPAIVEHAGMAVLRDRVIVATGAKREEAAAALDALTPAMQPVIVADPGDPQSWALARREAEKRSAKIWVLRTNGGSPPPVSACEPGGYDMAGAIESWIAEEDLPRLAAV